jgi:hypothetical protein
MHGAGVGAKMQLQKKKELKPAQANAVNRILRSATARFRRGVDGESQAVATGLPAA